MSAQRARSFAILVSLLFLVPLAMQAQGASLELSSDAIVVYQGQDRIITTGTGELNFEYLDTPICTNTSQTGTNADFGICRAWRPTGWSNTFSQIISGGAEQNARAGVGVRYVLAQACVDQTTQPVTITTTYTRNGSRSGTPISVQSGMSIYGHAFDGRGDLLTGESSATLLEDTAAIPSTPAQTTKTLHNVLPPKALAGNETYTALLWSKSTVNLHTSGHGHAEASITIRNYTFDWTDATRPFANHTLSPAPGGSAPFSGSGDGVKWFHSDFTLRIQGNDTESCPTYAYYRTAEGGTYLPLPIGWSRESVAVTFSSDARYDLDYFVQNGQLMNTDSVAVPAGIDRVPPQIIVEQPPPDGENGWHVTLPTLNISATDATSGWWKGDYRLKASDGWSNWPGQSFSVLAKTGNNVVGTRAWDRSNWVTHRNDSVKVDLTNPVVSATCFGTIGRNGTCSTTNNSFWYNTNITVSVVCSDPEAPCTTRQYSIEGAPWVDYTAPFLITKEGETNLSVYAKNEAGRESWASYKMILDRTPPIMQAVNQTVASIPFKINASDADPVQVINASPRWSWWAIDERSGIRDYWAQWQKGNGGQQVVVNFANTKTNNSVAADVIDGKNCLRAKARDWALNVGTPLETCVYVDDTPPKVTIFQPKNGSVYLNGDLLIDTKQNALPAVVLGDIDFKTLVVDEAEPGSTFATGAIEHRVLLDGAAWTPADGSSFECAVNVTCTQRFSKGFWSASRPADLVGFHNMSVTSSDYVGNRNDSQQTKFDHVMLLALTGNNAMSIPAVDLHWLPYTGPDTFVRWEIHRSVTAGFTPSAASFVTTVDGAGSTFYQDAGLHVQPGVKLYYRVVAITSAYDPLDTAKTATNEYPALYVVGGAKSIAMRPVPENEVPNQN